MLSRSDEDLFLNGSELKVADLVLYWSRVTDNDKVGLLNTEFNDPKVPPTATGANRSPRHRILGPSSYFCPMRVSQQNHAIGMAFLLFLSVPLVASSQDLAWVNGIGGIGYDEARGLVVTSNGDVLVTGEFNDVVDFDPGPGVYEIASAGGSDAFLACYTNDGAIKWAVTLAGVEASQGYAIALTPNGQIVTTGIFTGTIDLDPGPGVDLHTCQGEEDIYLCKFDLSGNLIWGVTFGGADNEETRSIACDASGSIYISGLIEGTVDVDPGVGETLLTSQGDMDVLVAKYDTDGNFIWAHSMGSTAEDLSYDVAIRGNGNCYVTGHYAGTVDFDPGPGVTTLSTTTQWSNGYLFCLDQNGEFLWVRDIGGDGTDSGRGAVVDHQGDVVVVCRFANTIQLISGSDTLIFTTFGPDHGDADILVVKYDDLGDVLWANQIGGELQNMPRGVTVDGQDNIIMTGRTKGTIDMDPGPGESLHTAAGLFDMFLGKYDPLGNFIWGLTLGSANHMRGFSVAADGSGSVYVTGWMTFSVDFDPGPDSTIITVLGSSPDSYLAKYSDEELLPLSLTMDLDGQPSESNWKIVDANSNTLFSDTGKIDQEGQSVTTNWQVLEGCYRLVVNDVGGDGLASDGYVLSSGDQTIIDANGDFEAVSAIADEGASCLPLGPTGLAEATCSEYDQLPASTLQIDPVPDATAYDLWIFDPHGSYTTVVNVSSDMVLVSDLPSGIPLGVEMNVRVRAWVDGAVTAYGRGCAVIFDLSIGTAEIAQDQISLRPNPCSTTAWITVPQASSLDQTSVIVRDALGRMALDPQHIVEMGSGTWQLDLSSVAPGAYVVTIADQSSTHTMRLVVDGTGR